jgi:hypothetical protein
MSDLTNKRQAPLTATADERAQCEDVDKLSVLDTRNESDAPLKIE